MQRQSFSYKNFQCFLISLLFTSDQLNNYVAAMIDRLVTFTSLRNLSGFSKITRSLFIICD